jgi:hypothetical protein
MLELGRNPRSVRLAFAKPSLQALTLPGNPCTQDPSLAITALVLRVLHTVPDRVSCAGSDHTADSRTCARRSNRRTHKRPGAETYGAAGDCAFLTSGQRLTRASGQ